MSPVSTLAHSWSHEIGAHAAAQGQALLAHRDTEFEETDRFLDSVIRTCRSSSRLHLNFPSSEYPHKE